MTNPAAQVSRITAFPIALFIIAIVVSVSCASSDGQTGAPEAAERQDQGDAESTEVSVVDGESLEEAAAKAEELESLAEEQSRSIEELSSQLNELSDALASEQARAASLAEDLAAAQEVAGEAMLAVEAAEAALQTVRASGETDSEPVPETSADPAPVAAVPPRSTPTPTTTPLPTATAIAEDEPRGNPCPGFSLDDVAADPTGDWDGDRLGNSYEFYNSDEPCTYRSLTCEDLERLLDEGESFVIRRDQRDSVAADSDDCLFALRT